MKLIYLFTLLFITFSCTSEKKLGFSITNTKLEGFSFRLDSVLQTVQNNSEIAFMAGNITNWSFARTYYIIAKQNKVWHSYKYFIKGYSTPSEPGFSIIEKPIDQKFADSILQKLISLNTWQIADKNGGMCFSEDENPPLDSIQKYSCAIRDAGSSQIVTFYNQNIMNIKEYNSPAFYQDCCPYKKDRDVFLQSFNAIQSIKSNF